MRYRYFQLFVIRSIKNIYTSLLLHHSFVCSMRQLLLLLFRIRWKKGECVNHEKNSISFSIRTSFLKHFDDALRSYRL